MLFEPLTAISSIDGRYRDLLEQFSERFSEFSLIRARIRVECEYLLALSEEKKLGIRKLTAEEQDILRDLWRISIDDARIVKAIEKYGYGGILATNHDVKAVEYYLKLKLAETSLADISELVHFALTSEDVDNIAYALLLGDVLDVELIPAIENVRKNLADLSEKYGATPMLARTHGQPASPTTFGKEMRVFESRISRQLEQLKKTHILVKFSGATGNYNAHTVSVPDVDWQIFSEKFVQQFNTKSEIKLELNNAITQIEPHDTYAELFDNLRRVNTVLIGFSQDMWRYVSDGWITQKVKGGEVGSSAMPHKVNPIDFENAEGNFGVANALFEHFSRKLPISRLQRDLSDSTVKRTFGTAFAHSLIGYKSLLRGLGKINVNAQAMLEDLQAHPEVLAEAFQTVLRREGVEVPYEKLKELTRGKQVTLADFSEFIDGLSVSDEVKKRLKALRPENYIGLAVEIAKG
ncbi:adenylosuccinate lyase [Candidatus Kaiserbacteria bacterium RIFCSPHIGHO2_12_FULL_53_13]|uniref:Adenylosuccinate lyase n=1 Tax=Candidatus Kaiserbacteria bacterium RIFCSPHIGHO2_12_FULL_53_13 TaxID=1798502 RepID=A0A1F6EC76_9BACT|nr:MAG: adenylosuccinate lyase [Candidatus Kaiserbacteria bacterium RIFCSPHIGHO2_12_FULL_53_13]OGG74722.1 MAG: adenylosuccinate lyase [Candidatus Kaiserbacteria bacterium RIFCSPLOWO2_01_FULL_52_36]